MYYSGVSGRGVGKFFGMSKANVYNWIKKRIIPKNDYHILEADELYWFIGQKSRTETRGNMYLITIVSRNPRQIVGFDVAFDKSPKRIQRLVDIAPPAEKYATDGYWGYIDIAYYGEHIRDIYDKSDTFTVEGVNADLRHYIPILARRSRCFARSLDTMRAALAVFVEAYNAFGVAKQRFKEQFSNKELPFSVLNYL